MRLRGTPKAAPARQVNQTARFVLAYLVFSELIQSDDCERLWALNRIIMLVGELLLALVLTLPAAAQTRANDSDYIPAPQLSTDRPDPAYPMNYADEAAHSLGIERGYMTLFSSEPRRGDTFTPDFKGGIYHGRAMLLFQWRLSK